MELQSLKNYFERAEKGKVFNYSISEPFSWRGSYDEVAFDITDNKMTREQILENINKAYTGEFYGYKGGKYTYRDFTTVHFEADYGSYTDGGYCSRKIAEIEREQEYKSQEARLIEIAFI